MDISFEWDPLKARSNLLKHGISFEEARDVFYDPFRILMHDARFGGEDRYLLMGESLRERVLCVAFVERRDKIRIISARKAVRSERQRYGDQDQAQ